MGRGYGGQVSQWDKDPATEKALNASAGQVLTVDFNETSNIKWDNRSLARDFFYQSALYKISNYLTAVDSTQTLTLNQLVTYPWFVERPTTFDQVALEVTTAVASSTVRIGLYNASSDGLPTSLIADYGTIDSSSTGAKTITISQSLSIGLYFIAYAAQGGGPAVRSRPANFAGFGNGTGTGNANVFVLNDTASRSGALPSTFGTIAYLQNNCAKIMWRTT